MEADKLILQVIWRCKGPKRTKPILKKNTVRGLILFAFKTYYKATVIKTVRYWLKNRSME